MRLPALGKVVGGTLYGDSTYQALYGTTNGTSEGTRIDCPVASALYTGTPYYGSPAAKVDGSLIGTKLVGEGGGLIG
jgi:hypothetical protein